VFTLLTYNLFCLSAPFLFVFGDDRVICHTGAGVIPSDDSDA